MTNPRLTLVVLPILPLALIAVHGLRRASAQPLFVRVQLRLSALNTILQENLAGIKVVKAFAREPQRAGALRARGRRLDGAACCKVARLFTFLFPLIFLIANLGQAAVLYFGGQQIIDGTLTLGEWQKFSLYLVYVFFPLGQLGFIITQMSQAAASAGRIFEILDAQSDVADKPGARAAAAGRRAGSSSRTSPSATSAAASRCSTGSASRPSPARRSPCWARPAAARHDHQPDPALLRPERRAHPDRRARRARRDARIAARARSASCCRRPPCSAARSATTSPSAGRTRRWTRSCAAAEAAAAHDFILDFPAGLRHARSASAAPRSPAGRSSASPSPAPCCSTRAS